MNGRQEERMSQRRGKMEPWHPRLGTPVRRQRDSENVTWGSHCPRAGTGRSALLLRVVDHTKGNLNFKLRTPSNIPEPLIRCAVLISIVHAHMGTRVWVCAHRHVPVMRDTSRKECQFTAMFPDSSYCKPPCLYPAHYRNFAETVLRSKRELKNEVIIILFRLTGPFCEACGSCSILFWCILS